MLHPDAAALAAVQQHCSAAVTVWAWVLLAGTRVSVLMGHAQDSLELCSWRQHMLLRFECAQVAKHCHNSVAQLSFV